MNEINDLNDLRTLGLGLEELKDRRLRISKDGVEKFCSEEFKKLRSGADVRIIEYINLLIELMFINHEICVKLQDMLRLEKEINGR